MHYKNGREAKQGDRAVNLESGTGGLLHDLVAASTSCNARLSPPSPNAEYVTVGNCLHIDDLRALQFGVKDEAGNPAQPETPAPA